MTRSIETAAPGRSEATAPNLDAGVVGDLVEALTAVLDHSGARGTYHALKYADAVEKAEAALAKYATQQGGGE